MFGVGERQRKIEGMNSGALLVPLMVIFLTDSQKFVKSLNSPKCNYFLVFAI